MINTSINTWDSVSVEGVDSLFACSISTKPDTNKIIYFKVPNGLYDMGKKNLASFEWALQNKKFDYVARVNSSCYVDKKELIKYVQELPDENVFCGVEADSGHGKYCWGGCQFVLSKDVVKKVVYNKEKYDHSFMEDESLSFLINQLGIPVTKGIKSCSIDKTEKGWQLISYINKSKEFVGFNYIKDSGHVFFRVKFDGDRTVDKYLMNELFKVLK